MVHHLNVYVVVIAPSAVNYVPVLLLYAVATNPSITPPPTPTPTPTPPPLELLKATPNVNEPAFLSVTYTAQSTVLTYVEYRAVSDAFQNIDPHPLSTQRVCPSLAPKAGGTHSPGGEGVGGPIFWKTPDIGLASYSKFTLRYTVIHTTDR